MDGRGHVDREGGAQWSCPSNFQLLPPCGTREFPLAVSVQLPPCCQATAHPPPSHRPEPHPFGPPPPSHPPLMCGCPRGNRTRSGLEDILVIQKGHLHSPHTRLALGSFQHFLANRIAWLRNACRFCIRYLETRGYQC